MPRDKYWYNKFLQSQQEVYQLRRDVDELERKLVERNATIERMRRKSDAEMELFRVQLEEKAK